MLEHSALSDYLQSQGAQFKEWFGIRLPDTFKDFSLETTATRCESAWFDGSFRHILEISGSDALSLIDRISSSEVKILQNGQNIQTAFLNPQAKIIATAHVLKKDDKLWVETQADITEKLKSHIDRFIFSEDVRLVNRSHDLAALGIEGINAKRQLESIGIPKSSIPKNSKHAEVLLDHIPLTIFSRSWSMYGESGYTVIAAKEHLNSLLARVKALGNRAEWAGMRTLNLLRIEKGIPWYGFDMDENYLLPETGLEEAISYNKGCYTGQEIVARIKSRGQLKRKLVRLSINTKTVPFPQTTVHYKDQDIGHITSAEFDPEIGIVRALGYLKVDCIETKNLFKINESEARLLIS